MSHCHAMICFSRHFWCWHQTILQSVWQDFICRSPNCSGAKPHWLHKCHVARVVFYEGKFDGLMKTWMERLANYRHWHHDHHPHHHHYHRCHCFSLDVSLIVTKCLRTYCFASTTSLRSYAAVVSAVLGQTGACHGCERLSSSTVNLLFFLNVSKSDLHFFHGELP